MTRQAIATFPAFSRQPSLDAYAATTGRPAVSRAQRFVVTTQQAVKPGIVSAAEYAITAACFTIASLIYFAS